MTHGLPLIAINLFRDYGYVLSIRLPIKAIILCIHDKRYDCYGDYASTLAIKCDINNT